MSSSSFPVASLGFSAESVMSSAKTDSFASYFPIWILLICTFSSLIAMAKTSKTILCKSGKSRHPCLIPDLRGSAFSSSLLRMMLAVGLSYMAFIMLRQVPSVFTFWRGFFFFFPHFLESFYHKWELNFVKSFSTSIVMIIWFFFFSLLMWCFTLIDLWILKSPCIHGINPTRSWCIKKVHDSFQITCSRHSPKNHPFIYWFH